MPRGIRPFRDGDEARDDVTADSPDAACPDAWLEPADHRPEPLVHDLRDPGCRRRRALAILALARLGNSTGDLAIWFGLTPRQIRNLVKQAGGFAAALGYRD